MQFKLTLTPGEIAVIERYLPHIATRLNITSLSKNHVWLISKEEFQNLHYALGEVMMSYGFDENYDANAVGVIVESLIDTIQHLLAS